MIFAADFGVFDNTKDFNLLNPTQQEYQLASLPQQDSHGLGMGGLSDHAE